MLKRYIAGHFIDQNLKNNFFIILSGIIVILSGCLELEVVQQPPAVAVETTFSAEVMVEFRKDGAIGDDDDRALLFAVNKPSGWTINSITYLSPEHGSGVFNYLGNDADENEAAGIDTGWEDSIEAFHPSAENMHWQMYVSDQDVPSSSSEEDPDSFHVEINYTADNAEGSFMLKYYTTHTNNGVVDNETNIAFDDANTIVYDPASSPLVTFTVTDHSWMNESIWMKGSMSNWEVFPANDDGENGDSVAGDHVWTSSYPVTGDGIYQWGAIEDDGSEYGIWLIEGDNLEFSVSGTTITGTTDYIIAPDSAEYSGAVKFTISTVYQNFTNIKWKGTPTDWDLMQMYDDGTNGDETAGDFVWTCIVPNVAAGEHNWGAIEDDGTTNGQWLIQGDNPTFTLDEDLLTIHGQTNYEMPEPDEVTKTVLFSVDMTEWIDDENSMGLDVFSEERGDEMQVRGSFNNWGDCEECTMTRTPGSNIFSFATDISGEPNSNYLYQFYMHLSEASLDSIESKFGIQPVDWIGWETSPSNLGNREFSFNENEANDFIDLPLAYYYDLFPGTVLEHDQTINAEFTINMTDMESEGFNPAEDNMIFRTMNKWLNITQGFSDGSDTDHQGATPNGDGTFSFNLELEGPMPWHIYYKWGYEDVSTGETIYEFGGGLGEPPRIRYLRRDVNNGCNWPNSIIFNLDNEFALENISIEREDYDQNALCVEIQSENESEPVDITFNFDVTIQTVSDSGVHIVGTFNGWDPLGNEMLDEDGDGVYSYTASLNPGDSVFYKFINGNQWGDPHDIVRDSDCGIGYVGDRIIVVPDQPLVLDPVCLNLCSSCEDAQAAYLFKPEYEDWNDPSYQDYVTENVIITRGNNKPIFNYAVESWENLEGGCSIPYPSGTEWAWGPTSDVDPNDYTAFIEMSGCSPPNLVGARVSMRIPEGGENGEDLYYDVHLYDWGSGNSGGAVQYMRWPVEPPSVDSQGGLFFSEYGEGSGNNKYLEIYNNTGHTVNLDDLVILGNYNGNPWSETFTFDSGAVVENENAYVLASNQADEYILSQANEIHAYADPWYVTAFNGDDIRALAHIVDQDTTILDIIGTFDGGDPGDGWDVAGVEAGTKDHTLVRKNYVEQGNGGDWYLSAGTDPINSEWIVLEQNNWTFLGSHPHEPFFCDEDLDGFSYIGSRENSCYYISENAMVWTEASEMAASYGGHLATVTSQEEQDFLGNYGGWIGLTDENVEGQWEWVTGEPVEYTNWIDGEPNDAGSGEDYVERYEFGWNDHESNHVMPFFMEIPSGSFSFGVEETLSYGNDDPDNWGSFSQYPGDAMLMAYQVPADGYITDLNIPISNGAENMVARVSLHRLSYPYNEFGENYSDDVVDSDGWIGGYDMDADGNLFITGDQYTPGGTSSPCSDITVNDGARDPFLTDSYEIQSENGTVQTGLFWQGAYIDGSNTVIGATENIFNLSDWGSQPMVYKDEWIGILVEMIEGDWMSFYSTTDNQFDDYPFLKFYGNGTCNGTTGSGGWHIRSWLMKWDVGMLLTGDRGPMVHNFEILNTNADAGDRHVWADITDDNPSGGESGIAYVDLVYSTSLDDDETWHSVSMEHNVDNHYEAHIPGFPPGTDIWYYIYAEDINGNWTESPTVTYKIFQQERPHLFIYNTDEYDDWIMDYYLFNSSSSQDFDFWSGPYYGDITPEILGGYDLVVEISGTQGPWVMTEGSIREWLETGDRSYIIAGADYLWWMTDGSEDELPEGSFLRDVLGVRQPVHDIAYWNDGYGEAISRIVPTGHGISSALASFLSDSLVLNYDPEYELGQSNWIDGIIRDNNSEPPSFGVYSGPVDNDGNTSDYAEFFDISSYVEHDNGSRTILLSFDPLATNTSYVGSDPYTHDNGYYWTGVMSIGPLQSAIDEMLNLNMTFGVDNTISLPGQTVSVSVWADVPNDMPMYSYEISVVGFGGDMMNLVSVDTIGSMTPSDWIFSYSVNEENGIVITAGAGSQGVAGSGTLFNLHFNISNNMEGGHFIDLFLTDALINENYDIGYDLENGGVLILTYGDVSTNGDITPFDASLILQYLAGSMELDAAQIGVGDVTQDATLSALDAAKILDYSVGLIESLPVGNDDIELAEGFMDISGGSYTPGDIIEMPINIEAGSNIRSFEFELSYDPEVLVFNSIQWDENISTMTIIDLQEDGLFRASAAGIGSLNSGAITLGTIEFELLESFADQQTMVTMNRSRLNEESVLVDQASAVFTNALLIVDEWGHGGVPDKFALKQNYPNPFNPTTRIRYQLPKETMVSVRIYDIMGRVVKDLVPKQRSLAGFYQKTWNATNNNGDQVGAGMYIYVIEADNFRDSHKMVLMK